MEISVSGSNVGNPVFSHQCGDMKVMHAVARNLWILRRELSYRVRVAVSLDQQAEGGRCEKGFKETPCLLEAQRVWEDCTVSGDAQELVKNGPSGKPELSF